MSKLVKELNTDNFDATVGQGATLVDFWAPWCGPCRMQGPILEQFAAQAPAGLQVAKVNVDESPDLAATYGIRSIPALYLFKDGKVVEQMVGVQTQDHIQAVTDRHLAAQPA